MSSGEGEKIRSQRQEGIGGTTAQAETSGDGKPSGNIGSSAKPGGPSGQQGGASGHQGGASERLGGTSAPFHFRPKPSRRKRPTKKPPLPSPAPSSDSGSRRRPRRSFTRGRGRRVPPPMSRSYQPGAVGFGQIAPSPRAIGPEARVPLPTKGVKVLSVGDSVNSKISSANSLKFTSQATSEVSSRAARSSENALRDNGVDGVAVKGELARGGSGGSMYSSSYDGAKTKAELKLAPQCEIHVPHDVDSDDDLSDPDRVNKNVDLSSYAGNLTPDGVLLPVFLGTLSARDTPAQDVDGVAPQLPGKDEMDICSSSAPLKPAAVEKHEPMLVVRSGSAAEAEEVRAQPEIPSATDLPPGTSDFPDNSIAQDILRSQESIAFLQLPGLLPMMDSRKMEGKVKKEIKIASEKESPRSTNFAAAIEEIRNSRQDELLDTDLRELGSSGELTRIGKIQLYKSGKAKIVLENGALLDIYRGADCQFSQQLVLIDPDRGTCDELEDNLRKRFVCIPDLDALFAKTSD